MMVRLFLVVAVAANVLNLIVCTATCPANEEYVTCTQGVCRAKECSEREQDVPCPDVPAEQCDSGCICKEGFLRTENGSCVPEAQCEVTLTCGANEVVDNCPSYCESDYCPRTEEDTYTKPCLRQEECPPPNCTCAFNHRRAANGTCIPTRECPPIDCSHKSNEEYNACPPLCPTDDCSQASPTGECPRQFGRIGIVLPCNPRCRCIKGYWRLNGSCVPYGECQPRCPGEYEVYTDCKESCPPEVCFSIVAFYDCSSAEPCTKGCACKPGYLRKEMDSPCIPTCKCPQLEDSPECKAKKQT